MMTDRHKEGAMANGIKVGDFVKATGFGDPPIRGRVVEVVPPDVITVKVTSGGLWDFRPWDLTVIPKKAAR